MRYVIVVLAWLCLAQAEAQTVIWSSTGANSLSIPIPLGTPCGAEVVWRSPSGSVSYHQITVSGPQGTATVIGRCAATVVPAPIPTPIPAPIPTPVPAGIVFQTAFDIPEWTQGGGTDPGPTDAIKHYGDWTAGGKGDQILVAANRPGSAGNGFRHYRNVGSNANGGGLHITLPSPLTEMWVRLYMRNGGGLAYSGGAPGYTKDMYWNVGGNFLIFGYQGGAWGLHTFNGSVNIPSSVKYAATGGNFHCYEYHVRQSGGGFVEMWIDGAQVLSRAVNLGSASWAYFALGDNQSSVSTAGHTDYDDIAVSNSGRIGCL